jgi:hypothetical protein
MLVWLGLFLLKNAGRVSLSLSHYASGRVIIDVREEMIYKPLFIGIVKKV